MSQSTSWRPQPPSISDPRRGESTPWEPGVETETSSTVRGGLIEGSEKEEQPNWLKRAQDAYQFSTTYIDSNYRKNWEDSIRAFNNQHPADSKYNSELFRKRSSLFRPKTRAVIRKNEAAAAAAYFSNLELISVSPANEAVKEERASAEIMQQLLKYRLSKTIPWFLIMMGAIQDAQVQGAAIAHVYWRFTQQHAPDGSVIHQEDTPVVDLIPIENIRIDPSAHWLDPIGSSPYLIHLMPMYWCDVQDRMMRPDPKGRRWKKYSASAAFGGVRDNSDDSTRQARLGQQQDPASQKRDISDYDIVWVHRHIHRWGGQDWEFYTLSSNYLLTKPEPLRETVWHGHRPYIMGRAIIETHKAIPSSLPTLTKGLQEEANDVQNSRSDNVKFVLNKAYLVKRGKNVDLASLVRNTPGRITLVDDPEKDVHEMNWPDVTQSAYLEQDRIDGDFNDIAGNFSPAQVHNSRTPRESTQTMKMLQAPSNMLTEYMLKTHTVTFAEPVLNQIMMLEQHYETDDTILALAGQKAQVFQRYGINEITDQLLDRQLTLSVAVGMGATDPVMKLQRFVYAVTSFGQTAKLSPPGIDLKEVAKEMFGLSGYQDGTRFMIDGIDPQVAKLMQENRMLMQKLQQMGIQMKNKEGANVVRLQTSRESNATKLALEDIKQGHDSKHLLARHIMELDMGERQAQQAAQQADQAHQHEMAQQAQQPMAPQG